MADNISFTPDSGLLALMSVRFPLLRFQFAEGSHALHRRRLCALHLWRCLGEIQWHCRRLPLAPMLLQKEDVEAGQRCPTGAFAATLSSTPSMSGNDVDRSRNRQVGILKKSTIAAPGGPHNFRSCGKHPTSTHMADIIRSIHLNLEAIRIIELERLPGSLV